MKVLFISNLYPDHKEPGRGLPNARLVRRLSRIGEIRVVSPRPVWPFFPGRHAKPLPEDEAFQPVFPPVWHVPKIGSRWNPWLMQIGLRPCVQRLQQRWPFDLILSAWLYPDACAAAGLAQQLAKPLVPIAQGSDVHQYLKHPVRRRLMLQLLSPCRPVIARSRDLALRMQEAGFAPERLRVIYNGVDAATFHPGDPQMARQRLTLPREARILLWVGNFLPVKNPLLAVETAQRVQRQVHGSLNLVMVGDGPLGPLIAEQARRFRVPLILAGRRNEKDTADFMRAADVLCLTSHAEGTPNVVLEALACGTPVAATRVGGLPEIVRAPQAGRLVPANDAAALAEAILDIWSHPVPQETIARTVRDFSWEATVAKYAEALSEALASRAL